MLWAHGRGFDFTLIETMPLGEIDGDRVEQYLPLSLVRADLERRYTLEESDYRTGGPARYVRVAETGGRLGFITPLTHNFCESCNRVRVTCTGTLFMCLGQNDAADLRAPLRASNDDTLLNARHRRGHRAQAQGPRLHHRSPPRETCAGAAHVADGRLMARPIHFVASEAPDAQAALVLMRQRYQDVGAEKCDIIVALGGDGFMLQTLHNFLSPQEADLRDESRFGRLPDERIPRRHTLRAPRGGGIGEDPSAQDARHDVPGRHRGARLQRGLAAAPDAAGREIAHPGRRQGAHHRTDLRRRSGLHARPAAPPTTFRRTARSCRSTPTCWR